MKISIFFVILFFIELSVIISQNQLCASENALLYFDKLFLSTWGENGNHYASLYLESGQYILSIEGNTISVQFNYIQDMFYVNGLYYICPSGMTNPVIYRYSSGLIEVQGATLPLNSNKKFFINHYCYIIKYKFQRF